jgi:transcriptional regulator with PAS, ATPase and Fis domain
MRRGRKRGKAPVVQAPTEAILDSISDGVFTVDMAWRITSFNRAAEAITGVPRRDAVGCLCSDVFRSSMCETGCALRSTVDSGHPVIGRSCYIIDAGSRRIPISVSTAVLRDAGGRIIGGAETFRDLSEIEYLRMKLEGRFRIGDLESRSPLMQRIFDVLPAVAASPSTVLIVGETGTGKELVARTIHSLSRRNSAPFVAVNCGALPDSLLESELFGYKKGAFSGAEKDKAGRLALARGGTLFLDEIADMSPALQVKLLRVLQERTYEPLGATRSETADVRVIVATNRDLALQMRQGAFREDLYYRINVVRLELPPLRRRKEDIPVLVEQVISHFNRLQKKSVRGIEPEALSLMMAHDWPGNVRELINAIERSFIMCREGLIGMKHMPRELMLHRAEMESGLEMRRARKMMEAQTIRCALERNEHNKAATARELGIHKSTLFRKMKDLGMALRRGSDRSDGKDRS